MTQHNALQLLVEVSESAADRAAQQLAKTNRDLDQARERLALLSRFQGEYQTRFAQALAAGTDADSIANYRAFLAQLSRAIDEQCRIVAQFDAARGVSERDWRQKQHRVKSFELLVQRAQAAQAQAAARNEQRQTDERAVGLWQRRRTEQSASR
jgi:flagellar protein FliJ